MYSGSIASSVLLYSVNVFNYDSSFAYSFPVILLYVSSYRAIIYYQLFEPMKHKMPGMLSSPHRKTYLHKQKSIFKCKICLFLSLPLLDCPAATGCTVKVRPLGSRPSLPSSQHQTTWMFTTTKVRKSLFILYYIFVQFCHLFLLASV